MNLAEIMRISPTAVDDPQIICKSAKQSRDVDRRMRFSAEGETAASRAERLQRPGR
jgi:hypothetical protein